jgi:hypothetical protein
MLFLESLSTSISYVVPAVIYAEKRSQGQLGMQHAACRTVRAVEDGQLYAEHQLSKAALTLSNSPAD